MPLAFLPVNEVIHRLAALQVIERVDETWLREVTLNQRCRNTDGSSAISCALPNRFKGTAAHPSESVMRARAPCRRAA
jgi:hypothetical protein